MFLLMMISIFDVYQCYQHDDANALFKFSYSQVTGDIAALVVCTQLTQLGLSSAQVTGDIAALAACTQLKELNLWKTQVMAGKLLEMYWKYPGLYWKLWENIGQIWSAVFEWVFSNVF